LINDKKILITFDYELALGADSGTVLKCIIEPVNLILALLKRFNAKAVFFIDATYLLTLKKFKHKDFKIIKENIKKIIKSGNDIGLHLHPQWLDAYQLDEIRWTFKNFKNYRLHVLPEKNINDLFYSGKKILEQIADEAKKGYKISTFRAGGWAIQPFNKLKNIFIKNKINFDFSVNPGLLSKDEAYSFYDFRKALYDRAFWTFNTDVCKNEKSGKFFEVPISTFKIPKIKLLLNYYLYKKNDKESGDGKYISFKRSKNNIFKKIIALLFLYKKVYSSVSIDGFENKLFIKSSEEIFKKKLPFYTFVAHPKKLSENSFKNIEYLIKNCTTLTLKDLKRIIK